MNKYAKKIAILSLVGVMGATTFSGCGKLNGTQTVATYGDGTLSLGTASVFLRLQQANFYSALKGYLGPQLWTQKTGEGEETYGDTTKTNTMTGIEEFILSKLHAKDYKVELTDDDNKKITEAAKAFMAANEASALSKAGITQANVEEYLQLNTYYIRVRNAIEATADMNVSDEEAKQSTLTMIQVSTLGTTAEDGTTTELTDEEKAAKKQLAEQALTVLKEAGAEEDLTTKLTVIDENLAATPVSYGEGDETLDAAVREAVTDVEEGTVIDKVIEGTDGYYVVRFDKKVDEKATEDKKQSIISERKTKAYTDKMDEWKKDKTFKVDDKVWAKAKLQNNVAYTMKVQEQALPTEGTGEETPGQEGAVTEPPVTEAPVEGAEEQ